MVADIYIHVDDNGCYLGNGGQLMLTLLALELEKMGYSVALFDVLDRLEPRKFEWLDLPDIPIATFAEAMQGEKVITSWVHALIQPIGYHFLDKVRIAEWAESHLRFWCQDELLRQDVIFNAARSFIRENRIPTVISNASNLNYYPLDQMNYRGALDCWVRGDFQPDFTGMQRWFVGTQSDRRAGKPVWEVLKQRLGIVKSCRGNQLDVWAAMAACDWFLYWDAPKPLIFEGEGFGLALHEALACGCEVVARRTPNLAHLEGVVHFADTLEEAVGMIGGQQLEGRTMIGEEFIDKFYRFDDRRREVIKGWLA